MFTSDASDSSDPRQPHKFLLLSCVVLSSLEKKEEEVKGNDVSVYLADNSKLKRTDHAI